MIESLLVLVLAGHAGVATANASPAHEVPPDRLANYWTMDARNSTGDVPNAARDIHVPGCATVSFVVEKNGMTSHIEVRRVVPPGAFGTIAASVARTLRFDPTPFNAGRQRVFSWLIFPFNLPNDPVARTEVMQHCAMESLHADPDPSEG